VESPVAPHTSTPAELKERLEAEEAGVPFIIFRDNSGGQRIVGLPDSGASVTIGRRPQNDVVLDWDLEVSRLHATLERIGESWTITDDGLSSNGSFVNGDRLSGRHRLEDGDTLLIGSTAILFRDPAADIDESTARAGSSPTRAELSDQQRRVLIALCRPFRGDPPFAVPATNQAIADEVFLSVDAVKSHLRALFNKFGIENLRQNQKRARLVALAMQSGLVSGRDFDDRR
jgi:pSer/pThr/pTyr-binding forkhead associated (FHA) protein